MSGELGLLLLLFLESDFFPLWPVPWLSGSGRVLVCCRNKSLTRLNETRLNTPNCSPGRGGLELAEQTSHNVKVYGPAVEKYLTTDSSCYNSGIRFPAVLSCLCYRGEQVAVKLS